jgi:hypothetical protein
MQIEGDGSNMSCMTKPATLLVQAKDVSPLNQLDTVG